MSAGAPARGAARPLAIRDVIVVDLPLHNPQGREHEGTHPAVVVGFPSRVGQIRFQLLAIVPMTSDRRAPWAVANPAAYPLYPAGTARLRNDTLALIDQVRAVDMQRIRSRIGTLTPAEFAPIEAGLRTTLGL